MLVANNSRQRKQLPHTAEKCVQGKAGFKKEQTVAADGKGSRGKLQTLLRTGELCDERIEGIVVVHVVKQMKSEMGRGMLAMVQGDR